MLESEVLAALWAADRPLSPEEVRHRLGDDLAYSTVATILVRLHEKGAVRRQAEGRGYAYAPVLDQAALTARRMRSILEQESDPDGVLSRFVAGLDPDRLGVLRRALERRVRRS
jgi:predicted transcriptional regulator